GSRTCIASAVAYIPEARLERGLVGAMSVSENLSLRQYLRPTMSHPLWIWSHRMTSLARRLIEAFGIPVKNPDSRLADLSGAGLVAGGVILALGGHDPIDAYNSMWEGSLGSSDGIEATLIKACPLVLTGLAVATALRIGLWNIGGEGQLIIGATAATGVGLYA